MREDEKWQFDIIALISAKCWTLPIFLRADKRPPLLFRIMTPPDDRVKIPMVQQGSRSTSRNPHSR